MGIRRLHNTIKFLRIGTNGHYSPQKNKQGRDSKKHVPVDVNW